MKPGEELINQGITDLAAGHETVESLLVSIGARRLRRAGLSIPSTTFDDPEHRLYKLLASENSDKAHSKYNALIRRLVSFERAVECGISQTSKRIFEFFKLLGRRVRSETCVFLTGGATAVLIGWRDTTVDLNLRFEPELDEMFRALPELKEKLQMNIELAAPSDFIPPLPGWQERSQFIAREGKVSFFHYDLYSQALSKIERGHEKDLRNVEAMMERRLIESERLLELFRAIEPQLYRYPAIDPKSF